MSTLLETTPAGGFDVCVRLLLLNWYAPDPSSEQYLFLTPIELV
jgi:hypothetical protein